MRSPSKGPGLEIQRREVRALDPGRRGHERPPTAESVHAVPKVFFCSVAVAFDEWSGVLVFDVEVPGDGEVFGRAQLVKRRFHALVVVVFGLVMWVGVCDEVARAAGREGSPEDAGVQRGTSIQSIGATGLASSAFTPTSRSVDKAKFY